MVVGLQLPMQSVPITTDVVSTQYMLKLLSIWSIFSTLLHMIGWSKMNERMVWFGLWSLTPLSTIFQIYRGGGQQLKHVLGFDIYQFSWLITDWSVENMNSYINPYWMSLDVSVSSKN
jgi:hypothetical protein